MADRTLTKYDEVLTPQAEHTYTARIDRSAAGCRTTKETTQ